MKTLFYFSKCIHYSATAFAHWLNRIFPSLLCAAAICVELFFCHFVLSITQRHARVLRPPRPTRPTPLAPLAIDSILILLLLKFKTVARRRQSMAANSTQFAHNLRLKSLTDFDGRFRVSGEIGSRSSRQQAAGSETTAVQSLMPASDSISAFSVELCANGCKYYRVDFSASRMFALAPKMLLDAENCKRGSCSRLSREPMWQLLCGLHQYELRVMSLLIAKAKWPTAIYQCEPKQKPNYN